MTNNQEPGPGNKQIYRGQLLQDGQLPSSAKQRQRLGYIPPPPPWRTFRLSLKEWQERVDQLQLNDSAPDPSSQESGASGSVIDPSSQESSANGSVIDPRALGFVASLKAVELVNAALCLRRPILIEGKPGSGKTSLAYAVACELGLPGPYRWSIVSRTTLKEGLYSYDAVGRLQASSLPRSSDDESKNNAKRTPIGDFLRLGPMGMAFYRSQPQRPAVLLIDEIDKSDIDMPNDLLHIFEEGFFEIPELTRLDDPSVGILPYRGRNTESSEKVSIPGGCVHCEEFPLVFMTSNEAREFPPAFLRRCLRLKLDLPDTPEKLLEILQGRFDEAKLKELNAPALALIGTFLDRMKKQKQSLATDQLLNVVYLLLQGDDLTQENRKFLLDTLLKPL